LINILFILCIEVFELLLPPVGDGETYIVGVGETDAFEALEGRILI